MKILVKSLKNCRSYEHLHDGVSAFAEHVENNFATFLWRGGWMFVCNLFIRIVIVMNIAI